MHIYDLVMAELDPAIHVLLHEIPGFRFARPGMAE
jgi:hypothetical protein